MVTKIILKLLVLWVNSKSSIDLIETVEDVNNYKKKIKKLAYVTQTTLSIDDTKNIISALKKKFPK